MRQFALAILLCLPSCGDDTTAAPPQDLSQGMSTDLAGCLPGTGAPPCPSCEPRTGDSCPFQLIMEGRSCPYGSESQIVCLCGGEATWSCGVAGPPHD